MYRTNISIKLTCTALAASFLTSIFSQLVRSQELPSCETPSQSSLPTQAAHPVLKATISHQQYLPGFGQAAPLPPSAAKHPAIKLSASKNQQQSNLLLPPTTEAVHSFQPTAAQIAQIKAVLAKYRKPSVIQSRLTTQPPAVKSLPRWGDKDCLCHKGFNLFQQHRYLEAAAAYKQAGDNMLKAWGHPTTDVANALRGEAVCLSAAGQLPQARDLLKQAVDMYIHCGNGSPPKQLEDSLADLSTTYQAMGIGRTAIMVKASTARISALSRGNPAQAALEFDRLANN
jgi:tetratricopeptide (TPR) repeat protein